jgi:hypothetical protein
MGQAVDSRDQRWSNFDAVSFARCLLSDHFFASACSFFLPKVRIELVNRSAAVGCPDRATLEKAQHGGPTMGSGSILT